jgi:hypothetical protein
VKTPTLEMLVAAWTPAPTSRRIAALHVLEGRDPPNAVASPERTAPDTAHTIRAAAKAAGYSTMTLHRAIRAGTLSVVRPTGGRPRVLESELARWMQGRGPTA